MYSSWSSLKAWWCCRWCVQIIFVESQALRVGSAQCCFSTFVIRLLRSKYVFCESSFSALILVLFFTPSQFHNSSLTLLQQIWPIATITSLGLLPGAHPGSLFGCHDRPLCTAGRRLSIKADDKIWNAVTAGL